MATPTTEDVKPILSPLDLSLKINSNDPYQKSSSSNDNQFVSKIKPYDEYKSVSSEELLSLKLLHDRLSKTMELLLPQDKSKSYDDKISQNSSAGIPSLDDTNQFSDKSIENFDYRTTMKALLSLVGSENPLKTASDVNSGSFEDCKTTSSQTQNKVPASNFDIWSYWHEYLLSLYVMNSTLSSFNPSIHPPPPPPPHPTVSVPPSQLYTHTPSFLPPNPSSVLFQNMLNSIAQTSSSSSASIPQNTDENNLKNFLLQETLCPDYNFKSKKQSSYQLLKDTNFLYNSFAFNRNLGLAKNKLLDSPESFGVSLRGNQKYSIYYQQRPSNIFNNNNFISPTCQSSFSGKTNNTNNSHKSFSNEDSNRRSQIISEIPNKKSISSIHSNNCKISKSMNRNDGNSNSLKYNQHNNNNNNNTDKHNKESHLEGYTSNINNIVNSNIPPNIHLGNRYRETVFNCSCGEEFENLYSFTIHMKTTHHLPNSTKIDRTIPKLVRGQDMWINSETEQTKEILRCMRCHQSFRTLPELTMHMVETNHYSEIVYNDTGKCVFLNNDNDKTKSHSTVTSSPIPSSPGEIIRNIKRTWSNSNDSDIGEEINFKFRKISSSPISSSNDTEIDINVKTEKNIIDEVVNEKDIKESESKIKTEIVKENKDLQITEADSGTSDPQPDSDCQLKSSYQMIKEFKKEITMDSTINGLNTSDSVIRQIENFVEKNLPKSLHTEFNNSSLINNTPTNSGHRSTKSTNHSFHSNNSKLSSSKSNNNEKLNKLDLKNSLTEKSDFNSSIKSKSIDEIFSNFNYRSYQSFTTDLNENPLSSLQSLVETIQKNPSQNKEQNFLKVSGHSIQNKDYNHSRSPISCDSLNQLQALVAGTTANSSCSISSTSVSQSDEKKRANYSNSEINKSFSRHDVLDSSATLLTWYHKLGELLGLPQTLSQAMLTPEALKDLANSVLMVHNSKNQSDTLKQTETHTVCTEDDNNNHNIYDKSLSTPNSTSHNRECDPLEQLKNLLHTTTDIGANNSSNSHSSSSNKFHNGVNMHQNSPPTISKKAKCHFCNKPFANKGQVRLHISKGKCPSLLRSCSSNCNPIESKSNSNMSPLNFESSFRPFGRVNDGTDSSIKSESENNHHNSNENTLMSKSVNLIREYFKFARQMIGNEDSMKSPKNLVENEID